MHYAIAPLISRNKPDSDGVRSYVIIPTTNKCNNPINQLNDFYRNNMTVLIKL